MGIIHGCLSGYGPSTVVPTPWASITMGACSQVVSNEHNLVKVETCHRPSRDRGHRDQHWEAQLAASSQSPPSGDPPFYSPEC
jgi:hypothetical protein